MENIHTDVRLQRDKNHSIPSDKCPFLLVPGVPFEKRAGH